MSDLPDLPCATLGCYPEVNPSPLCPDHSTHTRIPCDFADPHDPHLHGVGDYLCTGRHRDTLLGVLEP